jgi:hypothetical protein
MHPSLHQGETTNLEEDDMPRIRCHYIDCVFLDDGYCGAAAIEVDPDVGCMTYSRADDLDVEDEEWEEEEEAEEWEEAELDEEDDEMWLDDDEF